MVRRWKPDPEKDPHISRSIQEAGLWNGMKKDLTQFALPMKDYTRTVYIDVRRTIFSRLLVQLYRVYTMIVHADRCEPGILFGDGGKARVRRNYCRTFEGTNFTDIVQSL